MWPRTDLLELLGIEHPIIQAPMAGSGTPALAAAVSNAGGLGSLGCGTLTPEDLEAKAGELRAATNRPFNLNFFAHNAPKANPDVDALTRRRVAPFYEELGLGEAPHSGKAPFDTFDSGTLSVLLEIKPAVASFHFGLPAPDMVAALKDAGCRLLCSATTVEEARLLAEAGVDAIIAQGWEAGGHRGTFDVSFEDFGVGTMALVPQVVDAVDVPVIAAGGIADGRGIAAAFALGASGVQMGTAFLSCPEAQISDSHRNALRHASDRDTRLTRAFSGRPARAKNNRYIDAMAEHRAPFPDFPTMYGFTDPLRQANLDNDDPNFQFLLYGQAAALNRELPAAELVRTLVAEAQEVLAAR
ncbi:MAG: nitronate monooxygenase [Proteobacteria bacterium]|nr:nitronate monooxygenase [Pseudomonadota bacterium]